MPDIRHRIGTTAPRARVYEAFATTDGLRGFWTRDVKGESAIGSNLEFFFGSPDPSAVMEVVDLVPDTRVAWRCVEGPEEWVGTNLTFELRSMGDETVVLFTHADWQQPSEFMHHCSTKWGYFFLGLKRWLEGSDSVAYPDDAAISSWR
ncbi:MAG TPA: SRPBCC domain-containing protein [Acidimicrobiales bacterium]|nr:SRPBCC domain-containing protein [Acidimicrobiales bacterium]